MKYVRCSVAVAPVRKDPAHRSEMTSQLLADEIAEVLDTTDKQFTLIRCLYDNYEGWVANNQLAHVDAPRNDGAVFSKVISDIAVVARDYLETPYLWGGKSRCGIDCSGFCQQVFKAVGIQLPRDAYQQAETGEVVGFLQEAQLGDLAFFDNEEGRITHVGMLLSSNEIIHAAGKVRIDPIDHQGIIHSETGIRTHRLRIIKRHKKP